MRSLAEGPTLVGTAMTLARSQLAMHTITPTPMGRIITPTAMEVVTIPPKAAPIPIPHLMGIRIRSRNFQWFYIGLLKLHDRIHFNGFLKCDLA